MKLRQSGAPMVLVEIEMFDGCENVDAVFRADLTRFAIVAQIPNVMQAFVSYPHDS